MRGSIRQKSKNSWQIQIYTGIGPDGKHRRHFETVRGRKGDAQRRLTELLTSLDKDGEVIDFTRPDAKERFQAKRKGGTQ